MNPITWAFQHAIYLPFFNIFVLLLPLVHGDLGLAIVLFTLLIKLILFPLAQKAIRTQRAMQIIQPEINHINEKHKDDKQEQAKQLMEIYKKHNINPFSGILLTFLQLPIIWYLYKVIRLFNSSTIPMLATSPLLYSFVAAPTAMNTHFLGIIDIAAPSIIFAVVTGVVQYFQGYFATASMKQAAAASANNKPSFGNDMNKALIMQTTYVFPVMIGFIAYASGAIALYFITSGLFTIGQELLLRRKKNGVQ